VEGFKKQINEIESRNYEKIKIFTNFIRRSILEEKTYNEAKVEIEAALETIRRLLFKLEKNVYSDIKHDVIKIIDSSLKTYNKFLIMKDIQIVEEYVINLKKLLNLNGLGRFKYKLENAAKAFAGVFVHVVDKEETDIPKKELVECLSLLKEVLEKALKRRVPNFFCMGYFLEYSSLELPEIDTDQLNEMLRNYIDDNFMLAFIQDVKKAIIYSHNRTIAAKEVFISDVVNKYVEIFKGTYENNKSFIIKSANQIIKEVENCIDELANRKDSLSMTFKSSIMHNLKVYYKAIKTNVKKRAKYNKEKAKFDAVVAQGKIPNWEVKPLDVVDLAVTKENVLNVIDRLTNVYKGDIEYSTKRDFDLATVYTIDFLKAQASGVVNKVTKSMAYRRAIKLMEEVGISQPEKRFKQYPFQFSGGMNQRIVIAIALSSIDDGILICDEPTTALDVTVQAQILELISDLKEKRGLSIIFVTHDLGVVANIADRIAVMYAGKIVESGTAEEVFYNPKHPYTWALLSSMPDLETNEALDAIPGTPPNMIYPPIGDAFASRNKYALEIDFEQQPPMFKVSEDHYAATWLLHEYAPKVEMPKIVSERIERSKKRYGGLK
jgi:oligopeptide/dipeptide ABC transporter ATP-binding protein